MAVVDGIGQRLGYRHTVQHIEHFGQHAIPVRALFCQVTHRFQQSAGVALQQRLQHAVHLTMVKGTEHGAHIGGQYLAFTKRNGLVGQAHGIAHRTVGSAPQQPQGIVFVRHVFGAQHVAQVLHHALRRHVFQRELQAPRQDGRRQLLRVGGGQDELDVGRRLFQRLQQGVEGVAGQHVHFVDQVDLEAPATGRVLHVVEQLAGILDLGAAGGVDLDQVDETPFIDLAAHRTLAAWRGGNARLAVHALGDDTRDGCLAHPTGTGKQVGMVQALVVQCVDQRLEHVGLPNHFAEGARTPFTCKNLITHRKPSQLECQRPLIVAEQGQKSIQWRA